MNTATLDLIDLHARLVDIAATLDRALAAEETTKIGMPIDVIAKALADVTNDPNHGTVGAMLWEVLSDYRDAVSEVVTLRNVVEPKDPATERRRILEKAEKLSDDSATPDRVRALIDLAAEWGRSS